MTKQEIRKICNDVLDMTVIFNFGEEPEQVRSLGNILYVGYERAGVEYKDHFNLYDADIDWWV